LNGDGQVTAWELYEYVLLEVPAFVRAERGAEQIPQIHGEGDVRVIVSAIPRAPVPEFSFEPTLPYAGGPVRFRDQTVGEVSTRLWAFGDGSFSSREAPVHTYSQSGSYTVELAVRGRDGTADALSAEIQVAPIGEVTGVDDLVQISLGERNGLAIGQHFTVRRTGSSESIALIEIVEWLGEASAAARQLDGEAINIGDTILPIAGSSAAP